MIISRRPIISIDVPQNRFTLENSGVYFNTFDDLKKILSIGFDEENALTPVNLIEKYNWQTIVNAYQDLY